MVALVVKMADMTSKPLCLYVKMVSQLANVLREENDLEPFELDRARGIVAFLPQLKKAYRMDIQNKLTKHFNQACQAGSVGCIPAVIAEGMAAVESYVRQNSGIVELPDHLKGLQNRRQGADPNFLSIPYPLQFLRDLAQGEN